MHSKVKHTSVSMEQTKRGEHIGNGTNAENAAQQTFGPFAFQVSSNLEIGAHTQCVRADHEDGAEKN